MMDSREWAELFGNPRFMPRLEVMRTQGVDLVPMRGRQELGQSIRAEMEELRLSVVALGNAVSELYARTTPAAPVTVQQAGEPAATRREGLPVAIKADEGTVEERQESDLVLVDSVVYSVEDDTKSKKGLFGRKKT